MKQGRILRGGLRIIGWRDLPDTGSVIDVPDRLVDQLVRQRIIEIIEEAPEAPAESAEGGSASPAERVKRARAESKGD